MADVGLLQAMPIPFPMETANASIAKPTAINIIVIRSKGYTEVELAILENSKNIVFALFLREIPVRQCSLIRMKFGNETLGRQMATLFFGTRDKKCLVGGLYCR